MMDLENGHHILGFDFELGDPDLSAVINHELLEPENETVKDVAYQNNAEMHIGLNAMPGHGDTGNTNGIGVGWANIEKEHSQAETAMNMETDNIAEIPNETSSETGHLSEQENESDFEELDLTSSFTTNTSPSKGADLYGTNQSSNPEETNERSKEIPNCDTEKNAETVKGNDESLSPSAEQTVTEETINDHSNENEEETNEQNTDHVELERSEPIITNKDESGVEQNSEDTETNKGDDGKESDNEMVEADSGESNEDDEIVESEQITENPETSTEQNQIETLFVSVTPKIGKKRRRRKSHAKKWSRTSPYRSKAVSNSPYKRVKTSDLNMSADTMNASVDTSTLETEVDGTLNDTANSQEEGDTGTGNDDSVTESPVGLSSRRVSRPPASRNEFYINDDALLDEMWKQTDPSAFYRKKRNSILFQKPKRMAKQSDLKPLSEEEMEKYSEPFKHGWRREIVIRGCHTDDSARRNPASDVYYFPPVGSKLRSMVQLAEYLAKHQSNVTIENFTFMRRPIGATEGEMTRNASLQRGRMSSDAHKRKRMKRRAEDACVGDNHDDNDPLYDKPEIVIERDSDEFLTPLIAASISSPDKKFSIDSQRTPGKRGRPSKNSISPVKSSNGFTNVSIVHPSREKCYITPSRKRFKATARKSTTHRVVKLPLPYVGVENLCSMKCPGLEGVAPLLHCNVCMCLFHKKCVNHYGDDDAFTCLRCDNMKKTGCQQKEIASPMQLDPALVKTLNSLPLLSKANPMSSSSSPMTTIIVSSSGSSVPLYKSHLYENFNEHRTKSPLLVQTLQSPLNTVQQKSVQPKSDVYPGLELAANVKQEPVDDSYDSSMNGDTSSQSYISNTATDALSKYLSSKSVSSQSPSIPERRSPYSLLRAKSPSLAVPFNEQNINKKLSKGAQNPLMSMSQMLPIGNRGYQLIPIGPPLSMGNIKGFPGQSLLTGIRPPVPVPNPLQQIQTPPIVPLQITTNNLLQPSTINSQSTSSTVMVNVSPSLLPSPVSTTGPVVVNAKSCAPLNGQLLTLPPAVVKRLTLTKPLALKINNRQINVPPSGFFQTAGGLKVFLPPNTFPTAEDNVVPGIDNSKEPEKTSDKKEETKSETNKDKDPSNQTSEQGEIVDKSALIRKSKRYKNLCFIKMLFGAFDCMECIFKYLNVQDLVSASKVCRRWRSIAQNSSLWRHVSFRDMQVSDWRKAMQFLNKRQVKSISLVDVQHCNDPNRTWHQLVSSLQELQNLQQIVFGTVPASVLHSMTMRLTQLESFVAEHIADLSSDSSKVAPCKLDIGKFGSMSELKELKLRGVHGLVSPSFSFSGGLSELGLLSNLEVLSVTSLQDVSGDNFHFISQLLNIRELSLGDCKNWTQETYEHLGQLVGLEKLHLEMGGESCRRFVGETIAQLKKLHTLELHDFPIEDNLGSHLSGLKKLKKLVLYPLYSANIGKDNTNALNAVGELPWLEKLDWILPDKNRMSIILDDNDNKDDGEDDEDAQFVPFLITASISEEEGIVASHTEYINPKELSEKLNKKLPKTQVKVYSYVAEAKELQ